MTARFEDGRMLLRSATGDAGWEASWRLKAIGYGDEQAAVSQPDSAVSSAERFEYTRTDAGIKEWFVNKPAGIEHGFTLDRRPPVGRRGDLRLVIGVEGTLAARTVDDGANIALIDSNGAEIIQYRDLKVFDSRGIELPSAMRAKANEVAIEVDDSAAVYPLTIDPTFTQQAVLTAGDGQAMAGDVAIEGNTAMVGSAISGGAVYVFTRTGTAWTQSQKLLPLPAATPNSPGLFGWSIDMDGDVAVVGDRSTNVGGSFTGSIFILRRSGATWSVAQFLLAPGAGNNAAVGDDVAISGNTVAATGANGVFVWVSTGGAFTFQQKLTASTGANIMEAVAIEGDTIIAGANRENSNAGAAYVFNRTGNTWTETQRLTPSDAAPNQFFGAALDLSSNTAVIGAPYFDNLVNPSQGFVYAFNRIGSTWQQGQKIYGCNIRADLFGGSVAIENDRLVVGRGLLNVGSTPPGMPAGSGYIFDRISGAWILQAKFQRTDGPNPAFNVDDVDLNGDSVILSGHATAAVYVAGPGTSVPPCPGETPTPSPTIVPSPSPTGGSSSVSGLVTYGTAPGSPRAVPGVALTATGATPLNAATDASGSYTLTGFGAGAYTVTPSKSGEVNGSISGLDAARVAQHVAGLINLTPNQQLAGDATNNGSLSGLDAARIAQTAAGLSNPGIAGQWKFLPSSRSYPSVTGPLSGENYEAVLVGDVTGNWLPAAPRWLNGDSEYLPAFPGAGDVRFSSAGERADGGGSKDGIEVTVLSPTSDFDGKLRVPVAIGDTSGRGLVAYDLILEYDEHALKPAEVAAEAANSLSDGWAVFYRVNEPGRVHVTAFGTFPMSGKGTLLNLRFDTLGNRTGRVKISALQLNEGEIVSRFSY
jgi:hypothetical protein